MWAMLVWMVMVSDVWTLYTNGHGSDKDVGVKTYRDGHHSA
jgi:hypothetical protein